MLVHHSFVMWVLLLLKSKAQSTRTLVWALMPWPKTKNTRKLEYFAKICLSSGWWNFNKVHNKLKVTKRGIK
jgi:hypothetical protein